MLKVRNKDTRRNTIFLKRYVICEIYKPQGPLVVNQSDFMMLRPINLSKHVYNKCF